MARLLPRTTHADHPLLAQVAHQAWRSTHAAAAAITRAPRVADPAHALIACAGESELLEGLEPLNPEDFAPGEPVMAGGDGVVVGLLPISAEAFGTLVIVRPALRRGRALGEELDSLVVLAAEALRAAEAERDLALTLDASVQSLAALLDLRDGYTGQHSSTVVRLCEEVGRRVGVAGAELEHLRVAAHLHDLGKIGVPDQILHKAGPLDVAEWSIMREHPVWGAQALDRIPGFRAASLAVRHHHERWDGTGYPDGLAGEKIPIGARVIAVCDAYEAMTSTRPYRPALAEPLARERIVAGTGTQFDPAATWGLLSALADH
jgi:HD-GYP domain-containing protein (c-di-GMP phosphodiesterase class II)